MQTLKMDFQSQSAPPVVPVMQFDAQSRFIGITLYNGGVPYEAPEGASYTVQYRGPGANNMGWYDTITLSSGTRKAVIVDSASKNVVTLELAEQALRVNGNVFVNLCVVTNTGYMLKTFPIICRVTGAAFHDTVAVKSFFYVTGITSEQWLAYVTACQDAQKRAEDAAAKFVTDPTLSISGKAADAAKVGEAVGQLKEDIDEQLYYTVNWKQPKWDEGFINTNGTIVDITNIETGAPINRWQHIVLDCKEHDVFIIRAKGGTAGRLWAFINAENQILNVSEAEKNSMDSPIYLYAPHNSTKIIINDWSRNTYTPGASDYPENAAKVYCYQVPGDRDFYGVFNSLKSAIDTNEIKICNIDTANENFEYGHYIQWDTGSSAANADFCCTGYIDISGHSKIGLSNGMQQFAYYDKDKSYVSGVAKASSFIGYETYSIPDNAKYVRFSVLQSLLYTAFYVLVNADAIESKEIIVSKSGNGNFTRLRDGVEYATKYQNSTVKVLDGVYDLLEEFSDEIKKNLSYQYGIELKNNVHVICSSGAKITALYNGTSQNVETYFSPFFSTPNGGDFTLENVWIGTKNTRYCVHDELGGGGGTQTHKYINCHMEHDSLNSLTDNFPQCIGGGLGKYTYIVIDGGYYKRTAPTKSYTRPTISYHNNFTDDGNGVSRIYVKSIYVDTADGTVTIQNYGNNTRKSILEISGCSLGIAPFSRNETEDSTIVNTEVVSFNNEIRQ